MSKTADALPEPLDSSNERVRLWIRLLKTTRIIEAELRERLRLEFNTTLPRFDVMSALYREERGLKMSEISKRLVVSNGNVTGIVDRLTLEGLVIREALPGDRRAAVVSLTTKGKEEFSLQAKAHREWLDDLLGGLSNEDSAQVNTLLRAASEAEKD